jgi:chromate transporter
LSTPILQKSPPSLWGLWVAWLAIGTQSFGGGSSTLFLIHQLCIHRGWLEEEEFVRIWALVQIAPGINLLKLTILIGHRLRGWPGLLIACAGLLLPSAMVTVLMTAGFSAIRNQPIVQAAMRGILPATIGLGLAMSLQMLRPLLNQGWREGSARLGAHLLILIGAATLMALNNISPALVLLLSGGSAVLLLAVLPVKKR